MPKRGDYFYNAQTDDYFVHDGVAMVRVEAWKLMQMGGVPRHNQSLADALLMIAQGDSMARKEIKIELVADLEPDQFDGVLEAARDAARTVLAVAMLVGSKKTPTVKVITHDFLKGDREWEIDPEEVK